MSVSVPTSGNPLPKAARQFIERTRGKSTLLEHEVKELLGKVGLPVPAGVFVRRGGDVPPLEELPYPVVAKVSSGKITAKSDVRGVRLNIKTDEELRRAVGELGKIEDAEGVLIEKMAPQGIEVIVGGVVDAQFGPLVMFGLGGIAVELFKDVTFGLAPITDDGALTLIKRVKGYPLLEGYRGQPPVDIDALLHIMVVVSELMAACPIKEMDLNPVALFPQGAMILDAKLSFLP
jgi:acetate---CoA ligase (ADP-forming) subunit beta